MSEYILFVLGVLLGGIASWGISHLYYQKSTGDLRVEMARLEERLKVRRTIDFFEEQLSLSTWTKCIFNNREVWIADSDNALQIEQGDQKGKFSEPWTEVYPNPYSYSYPIYLKINNVIIKQLTFISVDGGRIFVPLPEIDVSSAGNREFFWELNALNLKVCKVIGSFYIYGNLEGVARMSRIYLR